VEEGKGQRAQDGAYPLAAVAKTGQLRIPVFSCRLGNFEKIDLGTDFEKTAPNTSAFRGVELGIPHLTFLFGKGGIGRKRPEPDIEITVNVTCSPFSGR
jgi:hypothetical protein